MADSLLLEAFCQMFAMAPKGRDVTADESRPDGFGTEIRLETRNNELRISPERILVEMIGGNMRSFPSLKGCAIFGSLPSRYSTAKPNSAGHKEGIEIMSMHFLRAAASRALEVVHVLRFTRPTLHGPRSPAYCTRLPQTYQVECCVRPNPR